MYYKLSRLILTPTSAKPSTTAEVFIANPQIDQEAILGKLFFLAEIDSAKSSALKTINFFGTVLPQAYYQSEKISLREKMGTLNIAELFENALTKVNAEFELFCKKEKIKLAPKSMNIICGVVYQNTLVFSAVGSPKALLVHAQTADGYDDEGGKKIYKITSLDDPTQAEVKPNLHKLFGNINEGKIPPEGYVIFTNEILPEYITNKHLTKIVTTLPLTSAIEHMKTQLHKINSYVTFLALIIKNSTTPHIQRSIPKLNVNITTQNSLEQMQETETETERYLGSVGVIRFGRLWNAVKALGMTMPGLPGNGIPLTLRDKLFFAKKNRPRLADKLAQYANNSWRIMLALGLFVAHAAANPRQYAQALRRNIQTGEAGLRRWLVAIVHWFVRLSALRKSLLGIFILVGLLLSYNLYALINEKNQLATQEQYQELTQAIRQKQNQVEASLLYQNETGARDLLNEAQALIDELAAINGVDQKTVDELRETQTRHIEKISRVVVVQNPVERADFSRLKADAAPAVLVALENSLLTADSAHHTLYRLQFSDNVATILSENNPSVTFGTRISDERALFFSPDGGVIIDDNGALSAVEASFAPGDQGVSAAASYNARLYVLSSARGNIFRFGANYADQTAWIKENLPLEQAVDFGIDGYIYLLHRDGTVRKMLSGYTNIFELTPANPPLTAPTKLKLSGDSEAGFIHILEPSQKRIVIFDKQGSFVVQYKLEFLSDLKDFIILPEEKKIMVLAGAKVYEFPASHFE